ncbi:regulator of CtrA degradation [Rhodoligotrophos appendicifer]|uniref:protease adaptor protein RcdA n=1 Tax=Rhodoligotrophos appendicifer TaxID=987056 RepID=UPI001FED27B0|nr:DUF1465 family protein [Rhodoligotrophos appendicifer]
MVAVIETVSLGQTIEFGPRFATSALFTRIYSEGMSLVEEAADYLDGDGRVESRDLGQSGSASYARESMRLTTRLMQLASWLLLQRAVKEGELSLEDARREKQRINLRDIGAGPALSTAVDLPPGLQRLIGKSLHLHQRILRLDRMLYDRRSKPKPQASPVGEQINMLMRAFTTS